MPSSVLYHPEQRGSGDLSAEGDLRPDLDRQHDSSIGSHRQDDVKQTHQTAGFHRLTKPFKESERKKVAQIKKQKERERDGRIDTTRQEIMGERERADKTSHNHPPTPHTRLC